MTQNLLASETSPYLLQHQNNPVHWMPWGEAAIARARSLDRPILLSIGYAACHWCHVMAHESFEDESIAALMNANFICIKVDREERPDIDRIYMQALHALGEQGGWPLTMFLTPDAEPFWGGTYFPPEDRYGRPGFPNVLTQIARIWREDRDKATGNSSALIAALKQDPGSSTEGELSLAAQMQATAIFLRAIDIEHGGLKGAPKFPQSSLFSFLWTMSSQHGADDARHALDLTLRNICQGGIYDHLGGGMARYSVDSRWLVPHFEKMLYDNAQLVSLLARAATTSRSPLYAARLGETIDFVLREMTTPEGAFAASYDADSEGEEGKYYVWTEAEIRSLLDPAAADLFCLVYDVTASGNWEGHTILNRLRTQDLRSVDDEAHLARSRAILLDVRSRRIPPGYDDKVLADWNGLMIAALADAALATGNRRWRDAATRALDTVMRLMWTGTSLRHSWRNGSARHHATADGYANLIAAALALYGATASRTHLDWAVTLTRALDAHHWGEDNRGYYFASDAAADVIIRQRAANDDATPNANATMLANHTRLHLITGKQIYRDRAEALVAAFSSAAMASPFAHPAFFDAFALFDDAVQIVITGPTGDPLEHPLLREAINRLGPGPVVSFAGDASELPHDHPAYRKAAASAIPRLYLCRAQACAAPAETPEGVRRALEILGL